MQRAVWTRLIFLGWDNGGGEDKTNKSWSGRIDREQHCGTLPLDSGAFFFGQACTLFLLTVLLDNGDVAGGGTYRRGSCWLRFSTRVPQPGEKFRRRSTCLTSSYPIMSPSLQRNNYSGRPCHLPTLSHCVPVRPPLAKPYFRYTFFFLWFLAGFFLTTPPSSLAARIPPASS